MGVDVFNTLDISIHALRKESDIRAYDGQAWSIFQSTLSVRRATGLTNVGGMHAVISIHALRKESDAYPKVHLIIFDISIHALRKESDGSGYSRGAFRQRISIHALRKESDICNPLSRREQPNFNPRSP